MNIDRLSVIQQTITRSTAISIDHQAPRWSHSGLDFVLYLSDLSSCLNLSKVHEAVANSKQIYHSYLASSRDGTNSGLLQISSKQRRAPLSLSYPGISAASTASFPNFSFWFSHLWEFTIGHPIRSFRSGNRYSIAKLGGHRSTSLLYWQPRLNHQPRVHSSVRSFVPFQSNPYEAIPYSWPWPC